MNWNRFLITNMLHIYTNMLLVYTNWDQIYQLRILIYTNKFYICQNIKYINWILTWVGINVIKSSSKLNLIPKNSCFDIFWQIYTNWYSWHTSSDKQASVANEIKKTGPVSEKDMQTPPPHRKWPSWHKRCEMCWIEWKIINQTFPIFCFCVIIITIRLLKKLFKSGQNYREDWDWSDNDFLVLLVFEM